MRILRVDDSPGFGVEHNHLAAFVRALRVLAVVVPVDLMRRTNFPSAIGVLWLSTHRAVRSLAMNLPWNFFLLASYGRFGWGGIKMGVGIGKGFCGDPSVVPIARCIMNVVRIIAENINILGFHRKLIRIERRAYCWYVRAISCFGWFTCLCCVHVFASHVAPNWANWISARANAYTSVSR